MAARVAGCKDAARGLVKRTGHAKLHIFTESHVTTIIGAPNAFRTCTNYSTAAALSC